MSRIERQIHDLVALQLGARVVEAGDRLIEDLGAESADLLNLVATLEDRYGIEIGEEEVAELSTVADVHDLVRRRIREEGG